MTDNMMSKATSALTGDQSQGNAAGSEEIDLEKLAELIFEKFLEELQLENERTGKM